MRCVLVLAVACGAPPRTTPDAVVAPLDGAIDAPVADDCPNRSAAPGIPDHGYPADQVHLGDLSIDGPAGLAALAGIRVVSGNLTIDGAASLVLPDLEVVEGQFRVAATTLTVVDLPRLETVGAIFETRGSNVPPLTTWRTPRLESVGGFFAIEARDVDLACLAQGTSVVVSGATNDPFSMPRLVTASTLALERLEGHAVSIPKMMGGTLSLSSPNVVTLITHAPAVVAARNTTALTTITVSPGAAVGDFSCDGCPALVDLQTLSGLGAPTYLNLIGVTSLTALPPVSVDGLRLVDAPLLTDLSPVVASATMIDVVISRTALTEIALPGFVSLTGDGGSLRILDNPSLETLSLPDVAQLGFGDHMVKDNPMLPTCQAQAVKDQATFVGGTFTISGNGAGTCP